jgi:hypothetical protein
MINEVGSGFSFWSGFSRDLPCRVTFQLSTFGFTRVTLASPRRFLIDERLVVVPEDRISWSSGLLLARFPTSHSCVSFRVSVSPTRTSRPVRRRLRFAVTL